MSEQRPKCESMSIEEATVSNMWEIAAIVEVLERKGPHKCGDAGCSALSPALCYGSSTRLKMNRGVGFVTLPMSTRTNSQPVWP